MKRIRRGIEIDVPEKWEGCFPTNKTKRERKHKAALKIKDRRKRLDKDEKFDYQNWN